MHALWLMPLSHSPNKIAKFETTWIIRFKKNTTFWSPFYSFRSWETSISSCVFSKILHFSLFFLFACLQRIWVLESSVKPLDGSPCTSVDQNTQVYVRSYREKEKDKRRRKKEGCGGSTMDQTVVRRRVKAARCLMEDDDLEGRWCWASGLGKGETEKNILEEMREGKIGIELLKLVEYEPLIF